MTEQITVPRATWDAVVEALEKPAYTHALALQNISEALELVMRWIDDYCDTGPETGFEAIESKVNEALTAANAVTSECSKVTSEYSEQPQDKAVKAAQASMAHYRETMGRGHPQATEPAGWKLVPVEPDETWMYRAIRHHQPDLEVGRKAWNDCARELLHWHLAVLAAAPEAP